MRDHSSQTVLSFGSSSWVPDLQPRRLLFYFSGDVLQVLLLVIEHIEQSEQHSDPEQIIRRTAANVRTRGVLPFAVTGHFATENSFSVDDFLFCGHPRSRLGKSLTRHLSNCCCSDIHSVGSHNRIRVYRNRDCAGSVHNGVQGEPDSECEQPRGVR